MELKWLEDFLELAETGNFTRAAEHRNVTQPAFSRRIRSLEEWLGTELIDRANYPPKLTRNGELFRERAAEMIRHAVDARAFARGLQAAPGDTVLLTAPHTLCLTFISEWLRKLAVHTGRIKLRVVAANMHDGVMSLMEGNCDLLLCFHHKNLPVQLDASRYEMLVVGHEVIAPFSKADSNGVPLFNLPGAENTATPFLSYAPRAYLGQMVEQILRHSPKHACLDSVYENDMAEALKVMALDGHGLAWLPKSSVLKEVASGLIVSCGDERWTATLEIRLYRECGAQHDIVNALWCAAQALSVPACAQA